MIQEEQLYSALKQVGSLSTTELLKALAITRPTLSRLTKSLDETILRMGSARATRYAYRQHINGLGHTQPLFRITEKGSITPIGAMSFLPQRNYWLSQPGKLFDGLPPEIADMRPQGFLGRSFAQRHGAELLLPARIQDWSNPHILIALAKRGEDLPGNLLLGTESAERWQKYSPQASTRKKYPELAQLALSGQAAGSSAGGEQAKFSAYVSGRHYLVKFAGIDNSPAQKRWRDLLICEHTALTALAKNGIEACESSLHFIDDMVFLEIVRVDRVNELGRRAFLTLAAIDDFGSGKRDSWTAAALRLNGTHHISKEDAQKIQLIDAFGSLIGDSDRHFYNLAFFIDAKSEQNFDYKRFTLAPAFDKLPMFFAPINGNVVERTFLPPIPTTTSAEIWETAKKMGETFWKQISKNSQISAEFRKTANTCLKAFY